MNMDVIKRRIGGREHRGIQSDECTILYTMKYTPLSESLRVSGKSAGWFKFSYFQCQLILTNEYVKLHLRRLLLRLKVYGWG